MEASWSCAWQESSFRYDCLVSAITSNVTFYCATILYRVLSTHRPGGDIVVSGLSARARSVFRVVTSLSPPFVMESNLDEDGLCLRGLPCHRLSTSGSFQFAYKII